MIAHVAAQAGTNTSDTGDPFQSIENFFDSGLWGAVSVMLQIFVVLLWLALAYWTWQDARRRIESPQIVAACVALSVVIPFLGSVIYLIVRPPEYLDEARERELELLALEQRLGELGDQQGKEIVSRMLAREGLTGDSVSLSRSLRQAGLASHDEVQDLDKRLTELEFRRRVADRTALSPDEPAATRVRRARELPGSPSTEPSTGDTGRRPRLRRPPRPDQERYD